MRVTFVIPYAGLQGGVRVVAIYAEKLSKLGHDVTVVSTPQTFTVRQKAKSLVRTRSLPKPDPSYFENVDVERRVLDSDRLVTDRDVPDADVIVATYYMTAPGVMQLSPQKGAKAIFIQGYEIEDGKPNPALDATWRLPMHKIIISKWLVDLARDKFGDTAISHVPNSVDLKQFTAPHRTKARIPTVGLLYNTSFFKGLDTSLKALKRVAAALPELRVVAFGAEEPGFRFPLPSNAQFSHRPPQSAIRELYSQCDLWLCGSNREGFHLPPLEAMACRCPVVATRVGGPLDIIENGKNGYLVDVRDSDALAERALEVLTLPNPKWEAMSGAAYSTAARFTWDDATGLFERALRETVERHRRGELIADVA